MSVEGLAKQILVCTYYVFLKGNKYYTGRLNKTYWRPECILFFYFSTDIEEKVVHIQVLYIFEIPRASNHPVTSGYHSFFS